MTTILRKIFFIWAFSLISCACRAGALDILNPAGSQSMDVNTAGRIFDKTLGNLAITEINNHISQYTLSFDQPEYFPSTWPGSVNNLTYVRFDSTGEFGRSVDVSFSAPNSNWWAVCDTAAWTTPATTSGSKSLALRGTLTYSTGVYCTFSEAMREVAFSLNCVLSGDNFQVLFYGDAARTNLLATYDFTGGGSTVAEAEHILVAHRDTGTGIRSIEFRLMALHAGVTTNRTLDDLSFVPLAGGALAIHNPAGSQAADINPLGRQLAKFFGNLPISAINGNTFQYTLEFEQFAGSDWGANFVNTLANVVFDSTSEFGRSLEVSFSAPNANWWAICDTAAWTTPATTSGGKSLALRGTLTYSSGVYCTFSEAMGEVAFTLSNVLENDRFEILFYSDSSRTDLLRTYENIVGGGTSSLTAEHIFVGHRDTVKGIRCVEFRLLARDTRSGANRALDDLSFVPLNYPGGVVVNEAFPAVVAGWSEPEKQRQRDIAKQLSVDLAAAIQRGDSTFTIPPDDYRFGAPDCLNFPVVNANDLVIEATGATFWFKRAQAHDGLLINEAKNLTICGLSIDYEESPYIQGEIIAMSSGPEARTLDMRIDEGFPLPSGATDWLSTNASIGSFFMKADGSDFIPIRQDWVVKGTGFQSLGGRDYRVELMQGWPLRLDPLIQAKNGSQPGDRLILPLRLWRHAININHTSELTLENVTIYATPHMAISENGGIGGNRYLNCKLMRRPNTGRLIAANYDAFHSIGVKNGPIIENCYFSWACDDIINIHSMVYPVIEESNGSEVMIYCHFLRDDIKVGSWLEFYEYGTLKFLGEAKVASLTEISTNAYPGGLSSWRSRALNIPAELRALGYTNMHDFIGTPSTSGAAWQVVLETPLDPLPQYSLVIGDNSNASGTLIKNNEFRHAAATGIQLKCAGGEISGNVIANVAYSGIILAPSLSYWEGPFPRDVVISGNIVSGCGFGYLSRLWFDYSGLQGAISVSCPGVYQEFQPIRGIAVINNVIEQTSSNAIFFGLVSDSVIMNNSIHSAGAYWPVSTASIAMVNKANPIYLRNSKDVWIDFNQNSLPLNQCLNKPLVGQETSTNIGPQ